MSVFSVLTRSLYRGLLVCAICLLSTALTAQDPLPEGLPKLRDVPVPMADTLLHLPPLDWITFANDDVLFVNPVASRPFMVEERKTQIQAKELERARFLGEARERMTKELDELAQLVVTLPAEEDRREFRIPVRLIKSLIHHEDLMLKRVEILFQENKLATAQELLSRLEREQPDWPGLAAAAQKSLELESQNRLQAGDPEAAYRLLSELQVRNPRYPELQVRFDAAITALVEIALMQSNFLRSQYFLNQLQKRYPNDAVFRRFESQLNTQSLAVMQQADEAFRQNDFRQAAILSEQATRIWPRNAELKNSQKKIADRFQRLHVGVTGLPGECKAYPLPSAADLRHEGLTTLTLFDLDRFRDGTAYYSTRFFDDWEPRDLERRMQFTLRQVRQPSERQAIIYTPDVIAAISSLLDPSSPRYNDRFASYIESIEVTSPTQFSLVFRTVPPRIEPLLAAVSLLAPDQTEGNSVRTSPGGFRVVEQSSDQISYSRAIPEPSGLPKYHVAEIVEHRYESSDKIVQGLQRGEVSVTTGLSDVVLRRLQQNDELSRQFFIQKISQPTTHLLQFNPASSPLKLVELRKGLAYALDRQRLLTDVVLEDPQRAHGRLVTTPFLSTNPGRNVQVAQLKYDLSAGLALVMAAQHKLKGQLPPLTMIVAPGEVSLAAAEGIAQSWRRIGITVNVVPASAPRPPSWDILYRTLEMPEPVLDLWPFLTLDEQANIDRILEYPDWLKQELLELDRAGNQSLAVDALRVLHRHLADEAAFIPLWEVDQFLVLRKNLQGFPRNPVSCYQNIDQWMMEAWFQTELP